MRIAFAGTPEFAAAALRAVLEAGHDVKLVLTQPDRPAGRGLKLQASPVKRCAAEHHLPVLQPQGLRLDGRHAVDAAAARQALVSANPEVWVVAAYGLILPRWALDLPASGCLNIHASLLPRWRGAAPIQRAIEAGDARTGISIMQMDEGLDTGDVQLTAQVDITPDDTAATLHDRMAELGARAIVDALRLLSEGRLPRSAQPAEGVTYAHKIDKSEAAIDWRQAATTIERRARAFDPFPGLHFDFAGERIKLWRARVGPAHPSLAGQVLHAGDGRLQVACGDGSLELLEVQRPGGRRMAATALLDALPALSGTVLPSAGA